MGVSIYKTFFVSLAGIALLFQCHFNSGGGDQDPDPIDFDNNGCKEIIIDELKYDAAQTDEYEMVYAYIKGDTLNIIVKYGGGCGLTSFALITNGYFMESNPVQLDVILSFKDEDPCEALITKQICFNILQLATLYNDSYQTIEGTIILRLRDYENGLEYDF